MRNGVPAAKIDVTARAVEPSDGQRRDGRGGRTMYAGDHDAAGRAGRGLYSSVVGLGAAGALIAILAGTPAALVVATGRTCGCAQPPDLVVENADTRPLSVAWELEGIPPVLDGPTSGTVVVAPCDAMRTVLPQGTVHVLVTSASASQAFDLDIPQRFAMQPFGWRVARDGGAIDDVGQGGPDDDPLAACAAGAAARQ
jgi:hypothetical protein